MVHHDARTQYRSRRNEYRIDRIEQTQNAIFEGIDSIEPIVPALVRIGFRFDRIQGRSAWFAKKLHVLFLRFFAKISASVRFDGFDIPFDSIDIASAGLVRWSVDDDGP